MSDQPSGWSLQPENEAPLTVFVTRFPARISVGASAPIKFEASLAHPAVAISLVALIGSFSTLHNADRFSSRGRTRSFSQK